MARRFRAMDEAAPFAHTCLVSGGRAVRKRTFGRAPRRRKTLRRTSVAGSQRHGMKFRHLTQAAHACTSDGLTAKRAGDAHTRSRWLCLHAAGHTQPRIGVFRISLRRHSLLRVELACLGQQLVLRQRLDIDDHRANDAISDRDMVLRQVAHEIHHRARLPGTVAKDQDLTRVVQDQREMFVVARNLRARWPWKRPLVWCRWCSSPRGSYGQRSMGCVPVTSAA